MTDTKDPLDEIEWPTLAEQIEPYRKYGDSELAVSLLGFQRRFQVSIPALTTGSVATFEAGCRPADVGADYVCENCDEAVRGVSKPGEGVLLCPLCGETPGMLTLGTGVPSEEGEGP